MSKFKTIIQELEKNPKVYIAPVDVYPPATRPSGDTTLEEGYHVLISVVPIEELYLPNELNKFMQSLTSVMQDSVHLFSLWRDFEIFPEYKQYTYRLNLGYMLFSEKIGQKKVDINEETIRLVASRTLEQENLERLIKEVMPDELPGDNFDIFRRIMLRVYPNIEIAKEKFWANDYGAEIVPNIKPIYELFEKTYADRKRDPTPMEKVGSDITPILRVKVQ